MIANERHHRRMTTSAIDIAWPADSANATDRHAIRHFRPPRTIARSSLSKPGKQSCAHAYSRETRPAESRATPMRVRLLRGIVDAMEMGCHGWLRHVAWGLALALIPVDAAAIFIATEPWVRVAANARSAEGYMELVSTDGAALVAVRCDAAAGVAIRAPGTTGATVGRLTLPAGTP